MMNKIKNLLGPLPSFSIPFLPFPAVLLCCSAIVLQCYCAAVLFCCSTLVLKCYWLQCYVVTVLMCCCCVEMLNKCFCVSDLWVWQTYRATTRGPSGYGGSSGKMLCLLHRWRGIDSRARHLWQAKFGHELHWWRDSLKLCWTCLSFTKNQTTWTLHPLKHTVWMQYPRDSNRVP